MALPQAPPRRSVPGPPSPPPFDLCFTDPGLRPCDPGFRSSTTKGRGRGPPRVSDGGRPILYASSAERFIRRLRPAPQAQIDVLVGRVAPPQLPRIRERLAFSAGRRVFGGHNTGKPAVGWWDARGHHIYGQVGVHGHKPLESRTGFSSGLVFKVLPTILGASPTGIPEGRGLWVIGRFPILLLSCQYKSDRWEFRSSEDGTLRRWKSTKVYSL